MKKVKFLSLLFIPLLLTSCNKPNKGEEEQKEDPKAEKMELKEVTYNIPEDDDIDTSINPNDNRFNPSTVEEDEESILNGKTIYWLGSSVTYGSASDGNSMANYVAAMTGAKSVKEAVSGTTIYNDGASADTGAKSYTNRLKTSTAFDVNAKVDAFVCQISTNDCLTSRLNKRGRITDDDVLDIDAFDIKTTLGGVEFIIAYVIETWNCPVYFYSGAYFSDGTNKAQRQNSNPSGTEYGKLVAQVKQIAEKWDSYMDYNVKVIDLFNDEDFNKAASDKYYAWATSDPIHPRKAGYLQWWSPYIATSIENDFIERYNDSL